MSFNGSYNTTPTWSPKAGKHIIAYTTRDGGNYDIVTLDLDTKAMTRITQGEGNNEEPAFSPNGRAIAFARAGQGIFIANADGTGKADQGLERLGDRRRLGPGSQGLIGRTHFEMGSHLITRRHARRIGRAAEARVARR